MLLVSLVNFCRKHFSSSFKHQYAELLPNLIKGFRPILEGSEMKQFYTSFLNRAIGPFKLIWICYQGYRERPYKVGKTRGRNVSWDCDTAKRDIYEGAMRNERCNFDRGERTVQETAFIPRCSRRCRMLLCITRRICISSRFSYFLKVLSVPKLVHYLHNGTQF